MDTKILTQLKKMTQALKELKREYSIIRKEIMGVGLSENSQGTGLLENKTLREIVEETQFEVRKINEKKLNSERRKEVAEDALAVREFNPNEDYVEENLEEFPVVEIQRNTLSEERKWMKEKFYEMKKTARIENGDSLRGKTVGQISQSIPFSDESDACCVIKLANYLVSDLTDPQNFIITDGSRKSGPSRVASQKQEVFTFKGDSWSCSFLFSFEVNRNLRVVIRCHNDWNGNINFGIGFTPADVRTNRTLLRRLLEMREGPDLWIENWSKVPLELFISHGNLLVRGHMTSKLKSVVHVEILEVHPENQSPHSGNEIKKFIVDGKSVKSETLVQNPGIISKLFGNYERFSCNVEMVNCLNVTLRNQGRFYCKCWKNDFLPSKVLPFHREHFFGSDKWNVEAMFAYKIDSTDFAIVVAIKVGINQNSFAATFGHIYESATGERELKALMDPNEWKTHDYRKYAEASVGVQSIQLGNIRAQLQMTEEEQALFKIRVFAI